MEICVEDDWIYIVDGLIWMLVGMMVGFDFVFVMVEKDFGVDVVWLVVYKLVMY